MMKVIMADEDDAEAVNYMLDCKRILASLRRKGWLATGEEAFRIWEARSEDYCASWLILPETEEQLDRQVEEALRISYREGAVEMSGEHPYARDRGTSGS